MKKLIYTFLISFVVFSCTSAQIPEQRPHVINPDFDQEISQTISFTVPTISPAELSEMQEEVLILDARELEEYETSHIPNAQFIGYNKFKVKKLKDIPKDTKIVVYCSIGYRSEKVGEKLQKEGFSNVTNLYGSIFEWANQGFPLVTENNAPTIKVHTYNKNWSQWVDDEKAEKVW